MSIFTIGVRFGFAAMAFACLTDIHPQMQRWLVARHPNPGAGLTAAGNLISGTLDGPCESSTTIVAFSDTATMIRPVLYPKYTPDYALGQWIWFGRSGDSLNITSSHGSVDTNLGQQTDSLHNVVQYFRSRLPNDGLVAITTHMYVNDGDSVPYTLRIERVGRASPAALRMTCERAKLTITSPGLTDHFSIVPVSIAHSIHDLTKWSTFTGTYKVALVPDSLYQICRVPCVRPDTIKLLPGASVRRKY